MRYLQVTIFALLSFVLGFIVNHYLRFNFLQRSGCASIFSHLPSAHIQRLSAYYTSLGGYVQFLSSITKRQEQLQRINHDQFQKSQGSTGINRVKLTNYETYGKWVYVLLFILCSSALNYTASMPVSGIQLTANMTFARINQLLQSENFFIQSYLDVKSRYFLGVNRTTNAQFMGQIKFLSKAQELSDVFDGLDDTFRGEFVELLVKSVCEVAKDELYDAEYASCLVTSRGTVFQGGILIGMDYSMRHVQQAYADVMNNDTGDDYFLQEQFLLIDNMMVPMFRVYQILQARLYSSLSTILFDTIKKCLWLNTVVLMGLMLLAGMWMRIVWRQRRQLVVYNGYPLLIPFNLLKTHRQVLTAINSALECER